jgi:Fusaric acid resistance protein family
VGFGIAPVSFRLLPPLSPELRARRLLTLSLRDLRRIAITSLPQSKDWESRIYSRLAALPEQATPLQRAQLLATLSVGNGIISLRHMACPGPVEELNTALGEFAKGNSAIIVTQLRKLERRLASMPATELETAISLRARASVLVICEALAQHHRFFDTGDAA